MLTSNSSNPITRSDTLSRRRPIFRLQPVYTVHVMPISIPRRNIFDAGIVKKPAETYFS